MLDSLLPSCRMRLENAPLVHVLAQVVFSPVLTIERQLPELQERLATSFPRFRKAVVAAIPIFGAEAGQATHQWEFADRSQRTGVVLTTSSVLLHTTAYTSWEPFLARLHGVLVALRQLLPTLQVVERIGMRYVDLVRPEADEPYGKYVHMGLLGFPFRDAPQLDAKTGGFLTQSVATTPTGVLAIRSGTLPAGRFLPPDLDAGMLQPPVLKATTGDKPGLTVDFDHFTLFDGDNVAVIDFDPDAIIAHLTTLHHTLREAFDVIVTPYALEQWGPWVAAEES
jgi:uncharacterized protein (TIGR04255 family)